TLSVSRKVGLPISPTIYATFIQNGFSKLGALIPEKLQAHGINLEDVPEGMMEQVSEIGYADLTTQIEQIPIPAVREALSEAFEVAANAAYQPIYLFTANIVFFMIINMVNIRNQFKEDEKQELKEDRVGQ